MYLRFVFSWKVRGYIQIAGFYYKTIVYDQITEQNKIGYLIGIDIWHCSSSPPPWERLPSAPSYCTWFVILWEVYIWLIKRCIWCGATTGTRSSWTESFPSLLLSTSTAGFHFLLSLKILETLFDRGVFISTFLNIDAGWIPKVRVSTIVRSDAATWYETDWILDRNLYF